jgi:hypothetical protein
MTERVWTDEFRFIAGVIRLRDLGYLALEDESARGVEHSVFLEWDAGQWADCGGAPWGTVSFSTCLYPIHQGIAIAESGEAMLMGSGDIHEEEIGDGDCSPMDRGYLRRVRGIAGKAYAAGMDRQVYRRDDRNRWTCIDRDMRPTGDGTCGFEGIDGFAHDDLYAGGHGGELWHFNGHTWRPLDSPTNYILTNLVCGGDGLVYACGRMGLLLRGRGDEWEIIEHDVRDDLWGLAWFRDRLYLASHHRVLTLRGNTVAAVDFGEDRPETFYHLSADDGVLWSIGAKDVMAFDGNIWSRID